MNELINTIAIISLGLALVCAVVILFDLRSRPQPMRIMNAVWPITALYSGPLGLLAYFKIARAEQKMAMPAAMPVAAGAGAGSGMNMQMPARQERPFWQRVLIGTTHCGAGCTVADIIGHTLILWFPVILFGRGVFAAWTLDYVLALIIGVLFQYAALQQMLKLPVGSLLTRAFKIDFLSLTAWQVGMYLWMGLVIFVFVGREIPATRPLFWFMMQISMCIGFLTAYPVNWWLIQRGVKPAM